MSFNEDHSEFFDASEFADKANIAGALVNGILAREFNEDLGVEGTSILFTCATAEVINVAFGDALVVNGTTYKVIQKRPDGTGMTDLMLELQ